jgi:heme o synthase
MKAALRPHPIVVRAPAHLSADAISSASGHAALLPGSKSLLSIYADLFKARLTLLVLLTTLAGFYVGSREAVDFSLMVHALFGTALVACGASALNQLLEKSYDARMRRTQDRPLPAGLLQPGTVLWVGLVSAMLGLLYIGVCVNIATSVLGAVSLTSYLFVYTPLKRVTWLNTLVGAIPGGLPPLMGWTAARGGWDAGGLILLALLAFWQVSHFMAIAWLYRDEYARAGFKMLPAVDPEGRRTGNQAVLHAFALLMVSLSPFLTRLAGPLYMVGASVLGVVFLWLAIRFRRHPDVSNARQLFHGSLLYLPLVLGLMAWDKIPGS